MADREGPIQRSIIAWLHAVMPQALVHHSANERPRKGRDLAREIAKAKWNGMVPGFPDLIVIPYASASGAVFFEVKAEGNYATKAQKDVHEQIRALGHRVAVVRSIDDVRECLIEWGIGFQEAGR